MKKFRAEMKGTSWKGWYRYYKDSNTMGEFTADDGGIHAHKAVCGFINIDARHGYIRKAFRFLWKLIW